MKKKLEADLMSIAHSVLQMKNKSDINTLFFETQKLYEKLSVLRFVEENLGEVKPTIGYSDLLEKIDLIFDTDENDNNSYIIDNNSENLITNEENITVEEEKNTVNNTVLEIEIEETIVSKESESDLSFPPAFELDVEIEQIEEKPESQKTAQISFEDYLGGDFSNTLFVKLEEEEKKQENSKLSELDFEIPIIEISENSTDKNVDSKINTANILSFNDTAIKGISIDLNDKIAFVKHLFDNIEEDYNRVLNQLITYDTFDEAQDFIDNMVKPDYNNWLGKEDYENRFIQAIERKFTVL